MVTQAPETKSSLQHGLPGEGSVNLFMVLGIVLFLLSAFAFIGLAEDVNGVQATASPAATESIIQFDYTIVNNIHSTTNPTLIRVMLVISTAGSELLIVAAIALAIYFVWRKRWKDLAMLIVAMAGEELINTLFKLTFHRIRPTFADPLLSASGFSFPSGHSMASMVFYGLIAYFLIRHRHRWADRVLIFMLFVTIVIVIGYSRIYLGLHYPSDVLGGYAAGLGWLAFAINVVTIFFHWRHRQSRATTLPKAPLVQ